MAQDRGSRSYCFWKLLCNLSGQLWPGRVLDAGNDFEDRDRRARQPMYVKRAPLVLDIVSRRLDLMPRDKFAKPVGSFFVGV